MESLNKRKRLKKAISIFIAAIMILASSVSYPGGVSIYAADGDDPSKSDSSVMLDGLEETYYYGTDVATKIKSCISVADGYDGEVYLEYISPYGGDYSTDFGAYSGTWKVRAVAPATDNYNSSESAEKTFSIETLPLSEVTRTSTGNLADIEGLSNTYYAKGKIVIKPAEGFQIKTYMGDSVYTSALELGYDDLYPEDNGYNFNADYGFYFKRVSDNAETQYVDIYTLFGNLDPGDIVFDDEVPYTGDVYAYRDDDHEEWNEASLEDTIYATAVEFSIWDLYLDTVTVSDGTTTTTYSRANNELETDSDGYGYSKDISIEAVFGTPKNITVTATDLAGWETAKSFTLKYPLSETTATVTVPDAYVGQDFTPVVETESDGKSLATFRYKSVDEPEDLYTEEKPTAAGEYDIEATIPETDKFEQIVCYGTFTIKNKETVSVSLSVSDVYYGASPEPKVVTESDGKNDTAFWYKVQGADDTTYTTDVPTAVGKYTVMAVVPETDTYAKLTTTANFSIMKLTTSITVSVEDILVGETVDPKVQTDSDGEPVVEYKLLDEEESEYTTVKPTAAGEYNVRASVAATATHQAETSDISSFVISRLTDDDATVTVANSLVGDDYEPVLSTDSDGKDGAVFEYKALSAPEEAYSDTKPVLAGTYSVRATVQQTDMYEEVVCESSFTISKRETTATVTVPNTKVGQTYSPSLTTASDGKDTATFEYKLTDETEDDYSETQPTAAGEYTIRATVPETNTYKKIVCENTFTISLNSVGEATVTVPDTVIGTDYEPVLSTDSDGKDDAVFEYKVKDAEDSTYSEDKPTAAGDYTVRATIPETENYEEAVCYDDFTISKKTVDADVYIADTYVDAEYVPTLTTESDGKATAVFSYKPSDAEDDEYSSEKPSTVGTYIVRAVVPETDTYESVTATYEFTLSKHESTVTVTIGNSKVGEEYAPETNTDSNGIVSYEYKLSDAEDDEYSSEKPTAAGLYTVKATVSETAAYLSGSDEADFEITKNEANITVTVADSKVGQTYSPVVESESNGTRSFVYKVRGANDSTYTDAKPTKAGKYTVKATIAATDYYDEISGTADFEITKNTADATVTVPNSKVGETYSPTLTTDSDGADDATYKYMLTDDPLEEYSETQPTAAGAYTVFVTVPETEAYEEATATAEFTISKNTVAATVTVPDTEVGETYSPTLTTVSDGKDDAVFEYKLTDDPEDEYSTTQPTAAGEYSVRATVPETDTYEEIVCENTFTISLNPVGTATVTVSDTVIGTDYEPVLTTDSDGKDDAVFEYKLKDAEDSDYSEDKPTAAGTYTVRATIPETETYEEAVCYDDFTISKKTGTATVTVPDSKVGETYSPSLTTDSDGKNDATFEYKLSNDEDSEYSEEKPVAAGTYTVLATVPETDTYDEVTATDEFTISKNIAVSTVIVPDTKVGTAYEPTLTTDSDGKNDAVFEYKVTGAIDESYTDTKPTAAGSYTVRVTVPETDTYDEVICYDDFEISLNSAGETTVAVPDTVIGTEYAPVLTTDSDGKDDAVFEYKLKDAEDTDYSEEKPTAAGTYTVRATVPETDIYEEAICYDDFTISKKTATSSVIVSDTKVGQTYSPSLTTDSDGKNDAVFEYKLTADSEEEYSETQPTAAGEYTVRATVPETDTYEGTACENTFTISLNSVGETTVTVPDTVIGTEYAPVLTTDSDGKDDAVFEYKLKDAEDTDYSEDKPAAAGTYTVRATIPETENYEEAVCYDDFTISKKTATSSVIVSDTKVGQTYSPSLTTDSDGKDDAVFEYKLNADSEEKYSETQPTAAGDYTVRATIPETDTYEETVCESTFTISLNSVGETKVEVPDTVVGTAYQPVLTTDSDGKDDAVFEYKLSTAEDSEYTSLQPTAAGTYTVRATVPETETYEEAVCYDEFTISRKTATATVSVDDSKVGDQYIPTVDTDSDGIPYFEYKKSTDDDSKYSEDMPEAAGTYTIRATIPETDTYEEVSCTDEFTISRRTATASVVVPDSNVGNSYEPSLSADSDGKDAAKFEYKLSSAEDSEYTETKPTAAGTYTVRATVPETDTYNEVICYDDFEISRNGAAATVAVPDSLVGDTYEPTLTTDSDGKDSAVFEYKPSTADDMMYQSTKPVAAGTYMVRATIPATASFEEISCTSTFTIRKRTATATVDVDDTYVGAAYEPVVTTESDGNITFAYKLSTADDSEYVAAKPSAAGTYKVKATVAASETYEEISCTATFTISRRTVTASVSVEDTKVGDTYEPVLTTDSDGKASAAFEYKPSTAEDSEYTETKPVVAGTYTVRATVPETATYRAVSCTDTFTISKFTVSAEIIVPDTNEGDSYNPELVTVSDGSVSYAYKLSSENDTAYTATKPTAPGT
ncbi:MAG: hypothetical protein IJ619_11880 [Eubacterium sp.]|nr:hypothetical protein [Eubacterium sp.]